MAQAKGTLLLQRFSFIEEKAGDEQKSRIVELFGEELKTAYLHHRILAVKWYPIEWVAEILTAIDQVMGKGDLAMAIEVGKYTGMKFGRGIYKLFFKIGSVEFIFKNAPLIWGQLFNAGKCRTEIVKDGEGQMIISEFPGLPKGLCLSLVGWCIAVVTLSGGVDTRMEVAQWPSSTQPLIIHGTWKF